MLRCDKRSIRPDVYPALAVASIQVDHYFPTIEHKRLNFAGQTRMTIRKGRTTKLWGSPTPKEQQPEPDSDSLFIGAEESAANVSPEDDLTKAGDATVHAAGPQTQDPMQSEDAPTRVVGPHGPKTRRAAADRSDMINAMDDPPVGWLVIVRGPGKGRVLTLGLGLNVIGRSQDMRVCIDFGDTNISRNNHARIVYEPRKRCFLLSHGDGTNLTYLDNELVMGPERLEAGSEIQLGNTTLRFQALCGVEFDWQDVSD